MKGKVAELDTIFVCRHSTVLTGYKDDSRWHTSWDKAKLPEVPSNAIPVLHRQVSYVFHQSQALLGSHLQPSSTSSGLHQCSNSFWRVQLSHEHNRLTLLWCQGGSLAGQSRLAFVMAPSEHNVAGRNTVGCIPRQALALPPSSKEHQSHDRGVQLTSVMRPKSRMQIWPSGVRIRFPGWGSACRKPVSSSWMR